MDDTTPDPDAVRRYEEIARAAAEPGSLAAAFLAEYDHRGAELERLRGRTHEIQAQEMAKRARLDSLIAEMRARWDAAKRWTEDNGLLAEWASGGHAARPFWSMTSMNARDALARLVTDRADALAELDRLRRESLAEVPGVTGGVANAPVLAELAALRAQRDAVLAIADDLDDAAPSRPSAPVLAARLRTALGVTDA